MFRKIEKYIMFMKINRTNVHKYMKNKYSSKQKGINVEQMIIKKDNINLHENRQNKCSLTYKE